MAKGKRNEQGMHLCRDGLRSPESAKGNVTKLTGKTVLSSLVAFGTMSRTCDSHHCGWGRDRTPGRGPMSWYTSGIRQSVGVQLVLGSSKDLRLCLVSLFLAISTCLPVVVVALSLINPQAFSVYFSAVAANYLFV